MHGTNFSKTKYCPYCMNRLSDGEVCPVCGLTWGNYQPQPHHLPPGTVLVERYMVGRVLGEGGFGITYIGRDMRLDYRVAIKEYLPSDQVSRNTEIALDVTRYATVSEEAYEKGLQRFLNEARTLALMFKQPQIVTVHDFFEANGTAYIVMEYVDGTTFAELVKQYGGRIAPEELFPMIEPLFGALANVHKQGILHRDISPDNLMLENGNVRLLDFGSAREVQPTGQQTMTIALKKGYGPIEQYQGKGQGPWTDVYALSATIYYCLTGVKPPDAVERILDDELVPPRELGVDMPQWQEQALLYGMSVNPTKRYRTMDAMHAGLYLPPADTIVPSPAVLGGVAVLEAGFAPEEAQALSQVEEKSAEAVPQTEGNQVQENQDEALSQAEERQPETEADALSQMEGQAEQTEVDQTQTEKNQEKTLSQAEAEQPQAKGRKGDKDVRQVIALGVVLVAGLILALLLAILIPQTQQAKTDSRIELFDLTCEDFWTSFTPGLALVGDENLVITGTTTSNGEYNWDNMIFVLYSSDDGTVYAADSDSAADANYVEYFVGRADNFGWGVATYLVVSEPDDWDSWMTMTQEGMDFTITASYADGEIRITCVCGDSVFEVTYKVADPNRTYYIALTGEQCGLTNLTAAY